jgi:type IV pilus assembly protein PilC
MTTFHYTAVDTEGKHLEGVLDAKDKFELYHLLKKDGEGISLVSVEEQGAGLEKYFSFGSMFGGVKAHDKILFARNLASMLEAGLPLSRALSIMERQARNATLKKMFGNMQDSLAKGVTLSDSLKVYPDAFSTLFISMVRAGEESGNVAMSLRNVALQLEKSYQLTKKITGALMYPAVIFGLMMIIGVLMMVYMVPTLTATFKGLGVKLPLSTRIIIAMSDFLKSYFIFVIMGVFIAGAGVMAAFKTVRGQRLIDTVMLHTPVVSEITKQINSARTARTMSALISSGVEIVSAIAVTKDVVQNSYYKEVLAEIEVAIQKGENISAIFLKHDDLYPLFVGEMAAVGEETGKIGEMLQSVAVFYEDEVDQKTKDMSSVIEPFLMIFIGIAVGIFALSMITPIYSLGDSIN